MSSRQTTSTQGTQQQSGSQSGSQTGSESGTFTGSGQSTNQYGWQQNPGSEDITALRNYREQIDPSIGAQHSRRSTNLRNSFQNPLGQYTTAAMRDATLRSHEGELEQDYGQAQRNAYSDQQGRTGQRLAGLASLTAPTLTQTGSTETSSGTSDSSSTGTSSGNYAGVGSNTGSSTQSTPLLPSILGGAAGIGAAAM